MKNENWRVVPQNTARPRFTESPAKSYWFPDPRRVSAGIRPDEEEFIPSKDADGLSHLVANIPGSSLRLPKDGSALVDCGFEANLPPGYRMRVESLDPNLFVSLTDSPRVKLNVFNSGPEKTLTHGQKIAKIWIEPIYFLEWIVEEKI